MAKCGDRAILGSWGLLRVPLVMGALRHLELWKACWMAPPRNEVILDA